MHILIDRIHLQPAAIEQEAIVRHAAEYNSVKDQPAGHRGELQLHTSNTSKQKAQSSCRIACKIVSVVLCESQLCNNRRTRKPCNAAILRATLSLPCTAIQRHKMAAAAISNTFPTLTPASAPVAGGTLA